MQKKHIKLALAFIVTVIVLILIATSQRAENLAVITKNIITNIAHGGHGDDRDLGMITNEFIKGNTGSTKEVSEAILPRALKPLKAYVHPPFGMGACQVCHAPNTSKPAAILTHTVAELCYKCHKPKADIDHEKAEPDCNKCHNPHHADKKKLIREKITAERCPVGEFEE